jgi:sugar lactone lactonase YvrE
MKHRSFPSSFLIACGISFLWSPALLCETELRSLNVGLKPESSVYGFGGKLYVTLMGETRVKGDGDGGIVMIDGDKVTTFTQGLDDPKGIVFIDNRLITADFDTVWAIDAEGNKTVLAGPDAFPKPPIFLNDVALEPGGKSILVTEMGDRNGMMNPDGKLWPLDSEEAKNIAQLGRVYRLTLDGKVSVAIDHSSEMPNPNGVDAMDDGTILVAEFFRGNLLEQKDGNWRTISSDHRSGDGVAHDGKGNLYLSEVFTGKVWHIKAETGEKRLLATLESAADLILDEKKQELIVPDTKAGKLVFIPTGG